MRYTRGSRRLPAHVAQPAVAKNTGTPAIGLNSGRGAGELPQAIAALMAQAEDLATALFQCAPERGVGPDEVDSLVTFVVDTVLDEMAGANRPLPAAMVSLSAERFRDDLRQRLTAKIALRDMPAEGAA